VSLTTSVLYNLIDLIVPFEKANRGYKAELKHLEGNPDYFFEDDHYKYNNRPQLRKNDQSELGKYVFYDLLSGDQFFIPIKTITDKEKLWHWLSVFVGNNGLGYLRQNITDMIYDVSFVFEISKANEVFNGSGYCLYYVILNSDDIAIGLIEEKNLNFLIIEGNKLGIGFSNVNK